MPRPGAADDGIPAAPPFSTIGRRGVLGAALASPFLGIASPARAAPPEPRPYSIKVVESGHSLTDPLQQPLRAIVLGVGGLEAERGAIDLDTVPGSPMEWRWNNRTPYPVDAYVSIGDYDVMVITERVPLSGTFEAHKSDQAALTWFNHAWTKGRGGKGSDSILYASWVEWDSGPGSDYPYTDGQLPFRERLEPEMRLWEKIADYVNANRPDGSPAMTIIPGPLIMAAVYDAIQAGTAPGLTHIKDLFTDNIHINEIGAYLISIAHFSVIYRRDPRLVPSRMGLQPMPPAEQMDWMKEVVRTVLQNYPQAGLEGVF